MPDPGTASSVSIVFLNYNRLNETRFTVEKLLQCRGEAGNVEIIAVDNGSDDGTREYLSGLKDTISVLLLDRNYGIEGYNRGFEIARGDIIIVLDDDSHIESGTISRSLALFGQEQDIGIVAFKVLDKEGKRFNTWHIPSDDVYQDSFAFVGCGFAVSRDLFREIGFYPAGFFLYHNEIYVSVQVRLRGRRVIYDPQCVVVHRTEGTPRDPSRRIFYTLKNSLTLIWMYYPFLTASYMIISRVVISYSLALFHLRPGVATKAICDFFSSRPNRTVLSKKQRRLLRPFFYRNSIFHRILGRC